ncbi:porphobilinogen deaminase [Phakopsora pachyrhizi]|uniref:Porphobilinogen deaminase n=1 Tax=Phakopsora pachyrhizi TaxID=170000 RepID=A0AAV0B3S8_PHAPC|nr:porphobilinogen deaminase [Phakopsora pachyrhizi]KAI8449204.1 porphobilinogen deaminase [Phakopsora pachyrhizi]CAH7681124.1 porphobilinogen deaminase [Phakopsora pachyrhizi]CAH7687909.1 porphobilinogen deaminase [Phakopsora pachyrhizi]
MDNYPTIESYPYLPDSIEHQDPNNQLQSPPTPPQSTIQHQTLNTIIQNSSLNQLDQSNLHLLDQFLRIGTRNSRLALVQAESVQSSLNRFFPDQPTSIRSMTTTGDQNLSRPLYLMGGKSLWTKELEFELLEGRIDLIVHSLKDMPTTLPEGCELGAILEREDPRDALVVRSDLPFKSLSELPEGSVVGTSSVRRVAQLRRRYPQLEFQDIRGNLNTRFRKLDAPDSPYTAIVLATAGLKRLGCGDRITSFLEAPDLYYAVGQGAIGIEIRTPSLASLNESEEERMIRERSMMVKQFVKSLEDWRTSLRCEAERSLLRTLEGGCSVPVGVSSSIYDLIMPCPWAPRARITMTGVVTSVDGKEEVMITQSMDVCGTKDSKRLGISLADQLLKSGAQSILEELNSIKSQFPPTSGTPDSLSSQNRVKTRIEAAEESIGHSIIAQPADSARTAIGSNADSIILSNSVTV